MAIQKLPQGKKTIPICSANDHDRIKTLYSLKFLQAAKLLWDARKDTVDCVPSGEDSWYTCKIQTHDTNIYPVISNVIAGNLIYGRISTFTRTNKAEYASPLRVYTGPDTHLPLLGGVHDKLKYCPQSESLKLLNCQYEGDLIKEVTRFREVEKLMKQLVAISVETVRLSELLDPPKYRYYQSSAYNDPAEVNRILGIIDVWVESQKQPSVEDAKKIIKSLICKENKYKPTAGIRQYLNYRYGGYSLPDNWQDWFD